MYEFILFDLDNTLLDFDLAEENSLKKVFSKYGIEYNLKNLEDYRNINVSMWAKLEKGEMKKEDVLTKRFDNFFELHGKKIDSNEVEDYFRTSLNTNSQLIEGAVEILKELKKRGKKLYTASNGVYKTQLNRMIESNIYDFFDKHFISEQVGYEKPNELFFKYCFENIENAKKEKMLMIGDRIESDILGAKNFGIDSCHYNRKNISKNENATYTVYKLDELLKII